MTSCSLSTKAMLRQSTDRLQWLVSSRALPVRRQLALMQGRPLCDQRKRPPWKRARDHSTREIDRRGLPGVAAMELLTCVSALVPIHPDGDPVESADPRHASTIRSPCDETPAQLWPLGSDELKGRRRNEDMVCAPSSF